MISFVNLMLASVFCFTFYYFYRSKNRNFPPGPWSPPIVGSVFSLGVLPHLTFQKWAQRYGPLVRTKFGFKDFIIIHDPKLIREAFSDPVFNGRPDDKIQFLVAGGRGILSTNGKDWVAISDSCITEQRRFVHRTLKDFGFGKQSMENLIMKDVREFLKWISENEGVPTEVAPQFVLATVNSLWTLLAGERHEQDDSIINDIIETGTTAFSDVAQANSTYIYFPELIDVLPKQLLRKWSRTKRAIAPLIQIFKDAVDEHIKNPVDEVNPRDLIDVYITEIKKTTDSKSSFFDECGYKSLVAVVGDLYLAGRATITNTLLFAVLYLVRFPHVQVKFQEELDAVIGENRLPTLSDKSNLPYTDAILLEILRYSSITPLGLFHETMADTTLNGYDVKKGTTVIANTFSVHYSSNIWGDPESFRPERHLSLDGTKVVKSGNLLPFGTGKRKCPGESFARDTLFLFLTTIFHRFYISPDPADPEPTLDSPLTFFREPKPFKVIFKNRFP